MTDSGETPIGQAPATGGRVKQYASAAERAKAFRRRQKELVAMAKGSNEPDVEDVSEQPEAAITSLAYAIGELRRIGEFQAHFAARIDEAVSRVADPGRLDAALETAKTHALREVSEAQSAAAEARADAHAARTERNQLAAERDSALEDAAAALERLVDAEALAQWLVAEIRHLAAFEVDAADRARAAAEEAARRAETGAQTGIAAAQQAAQNEAAEQIARTTSEAAARVDAARAEAQRANTALIRAEADRDAADRTAAELRADLRAAREESARLHGELRAEDRAHARTLRRARPLVQQPRRRRTL